MTVRYPKHMVHTRQQALWQNAVVLLVLLPFVVLRLPAQRPGVAIAMVALALAPFAGAYQSWRFLETQERVHGEPTPEMDFAFRLLYSTPLAFSGLLLVVFTGMR
ncbi:MAG: hypothetical protein K2Y23_18825 [Cyanobacteria bacterium]|nr:hypothetical protein [Cyanobacteriota bacterium]